MNSRAAAARIIALMILERKTLDSAFFDLVPATADPREQGFIKELCYGVSRWYHRFDYILDLLLEKPIRNKDTDIRAALMCGLYQLDFMRTPAHAAVSATVEAAGQLNKSWAKNLINAVLRRYQRESENFSDLIYKSDSARYSHPLWLVRAIRADWPEYWEKILEANNQRPPMYLRVNLRLISRAEYLTRLSEAGIESVPVAEPGCCIRLTEPVDVDALPGFEQGLVSVQDISAQRAAGLLDLKPGFRVLDACAAPGGKTGHILETEPGLASVTAIEKDKYRLPGLRKNCQRLGLTVEIIHADAADRSVWWNGVPYDRILLDVPCSATGVIRRHPDVKILRTREAIMDYCDRQDKLLESAWTMLNSQGRLVYVTCSILQAENDQRVEAFLGKYPDASLVDTMSTWGIRTTSGIQTLPGPGDADGFYYAVLEKH